MRVILSCLVTLIASLAVSSCQRATESTAETECSWKKKVDYVDSRDLFTFYFEPRFIDDDVDAERCHQELRGYLMDLSVHEMDANRWREALAATVKRHDVEFTENISQKLAFLAIEAQDGVGMLIAACHNPEFEVRSWPNGQPVDLNEFFADMDFVSAAMTLHEIPQIKPIGKYCPVVFFVTQREKFVEVLKNRVVLNPDLKPLERLVVLLNFNRCLRDIDPWQSSLAILNGEFGKPTTVQDAKYLEKLEQIASMSKNDLIPTHALATAGEILYGRISNFADYRAVEAYLWIGDQESDAYVLMMKRVIGNMRNLDEWLVVYDSCSDDDSYRMLIERLHAFAKTASDWTRLLDKDDLRALAIYKLAELSK